MWYIQRILNFNQKKTKLKNRTKDLNRQFTKDTQMAKPSVWKDAQQDIIMENANQNKTKMLLYIYENG